MLYYLIPAALVFAFACGVMYHAGAFVVLLLAERARRKRHRARRHSAQRPDKLRPLRVVK